MSATPVKVLVIDDEPPIRKLLRMGLSTQGYEILEASSGKIALELLAQDPALIILDLGLPDIKGHELLRMIRDRNDGVPIVVLSSRDDEAGKVEALDLGADDYVAKPFSVRELLARVRVALRHGDSAGARAESNWLERGPIRLDLAEHTATVRGEVVSLTRTQFALLACFLRHPGRLLTHRAIVAEVWGDPDAAAADNLRVQISQLRRRIEEDPRHPALIVTEPGLGYRFLAG
jgi:two-component system KDP operon response regulator KdpE